MPSGFHLTISQAFMPLRIDQQRVAARYRDYRIYDAYAALSDLSTIFFSYRLTGTVAMVRRALYGMLRVGLTPIGCLKTNRRSYLAKGRSGNRNPPGSMRRI